jgi:methylmalonyl-CoA/ethylmalonyl-CoA epimerase
MVKRASIDHVTTVVGDIEAATAALQKVFRCEPTAESRVPGMTVRTFRLGPSEVHVSAPTGEGPAQEFLRNHGAGMHHLAIRFDHLDSALESLRALGVETLGDPFELVPGIREVFLDPRTTGGILIQAVERRGDAVLDERPSTTPPPRETLPPST